MTTVAAKGDERTIIVNWARVHSVEMGLGAITVLGMVIRAYNIGGQSLWFDELLSVSISRLPLSEVVASPASIDPPLYYILLHFWMRFGQGDDVIRWLAAIPAILTIPVMYVLGRDFFDKWVGLAAAFMFGIAPLQLYYAQEARMYSLLVLFSALAMWTFIRAQTKTGRVEWTLFVFAMALAVYTHTFGGLLLVALDLDVLLRWRRRQARLLPAFAANIAIGVLLVPEVVLTISKLQWLMPALWLSTPTILHPLLTLYSFTFGFTLPFPFTAIALFVLLFGLTLVAIATRHALRANCSKNMSALGLLWLAALVPILLTFVVSQWRSVYLDRLLLESAPAVYVLLAWGVVASSRRKILRLCAVVALVLMVLANVNYLTQSEYAKPAYRDAIAFVRARRTATDLVIHTSDSTFLAGRHYDSEGDHVFLYNPADLWLTPALMDELRVPYRTDAAATIGGHESYWLLVALDHIPEEQRLEKARFDELGAVAGETQIGGISIFRYVVR